MADPEHLNTFRQHVPGSVAVSRDPPVHSFATTDELLRLDVVKRFSQTKGFQHFAMSGNSLMAISDDGFRWFVVGFISLSTLVELPKWDGGRFRAEQPDGSVVTIESKDIKYTCGDQITMTDGTTRRRVRCNG